MFIVLFLMVLGLVLFLVAGLGIPEYPRFRYVGWGLFCVTLAFILERGGSLFR